MAAPNWQIRQSLATLEPVYEPGWANALFLFGVHIITNRYVGEGTSANNTQHTTEHILGTSLTWSRIATCRLIGRGELQSLRSLYHENNWPTQTVPVSFIGAYCCRLVCTRSNEHRKPGTARPNLGEVTGSNRNFSGCCRCISGLSWPARYRLELWQQPVRERRTIAALGTLPITGAHLPGWWLSHILVSQSACVSHFQ